MNLHKFTLLLVLLISGKIYATHYRGAELTYTITGDTAVGVTVTTYTKISGTSIEADRDTVTVIWGDGQSSIISRVNGPLGPDSIPEGVLVATDIKQNIYTGSHVYHTQPVNGFFILTFYDQNRMDDILNINFSNSVEIPLCVVDTVFTGVNFGNDASPVFLNPSIYYSSLGDTFTFNPAAYDADGDSLSFELAEPLQEIGTVVPNYLLPDTFCLSNNYGGANTFQFDNKTGQVTWATVCAEGIFQFAFNVKEFRCGVIIGTVERDMQIIVLASGISPPHLSAVHDTIIEPGQTIQYTFTSFDPGNYIDSIQLFSGLFGLIHDPPSFIDSSGNPSIATLTWQPDSTFANKNSYIFAVVATDNYMAYGPDGNLDPFPMSDAEVFRVWVEDTTTINCSSFRLSGIASAEEDFMLGIFPNPASDYIHLTSLKPILEARIFDLEGRQVMQIKSPCQDYGISIQNLEEGFYLLEAKGENKSATIKFLKIN